MAGQLPPEVTVLTDVNCIAIGLTENHPVYHEVSSVIHESLDGPNTLLVFDYYPFRAQYIMTNQFEVPTVDARNAVQSLIQSPARMINATKTTITDAYRISSEKSHDVYDSFLIALARDYDVDYLVTTDEDFDALCVGEDFDYRNPVPAEKRDELANVDG